MKLNKIFRQNNIWLSLTTVMAITLLLPNLSLAAVAAVLGNLVGGLLFLILFTPFIFLFEIEMVILPIIAQFNNFTRLPGIVDGWRIMRDVSNMFFIVVLLLMSFATILKMQTYGYKELLKNLIIMAILINFSKTIAGLIIDIGQVVMLTFVVAIKDVAAGNLITAFGISDLMQIDTKSSGFADGVGDTSSIVLAYFLAGIMILLASVVVMVFIIMLVMRIVILWILVVVSPIAFLANTFPITKQYFNQWLSTLFKEVMIGPVLIFFLWLSLSILQTDMKTEFTATSAESANNAAGDQLQGIGNGSITEAGKWENILKYIISISMLLGALKMTKSFGSMAGSVGQKFGEAAGKKIASVYYKGTSGAGGIRGGASRLAFGDTIGKDGKPQMSFVNRNLMRLGPGGKRAAMLGQGMEDKRVKVKTDYKAKRGENTRDKEAFHETGFGRYEKNLRDKEQAGKKNKLEAMKPKEVKDKTDRARTMNDVETLKKLKNAHGIANTESDVQDAIDRSEGLQRFEHMNVMEVAKKDENGKIGVAAEGSDAFKQGQMLAKGFMQISKEDQSKALGSMDKDSAVAMTEYVASLKPADLEAIDKKMGVEGHVDVNTETREVDQEAIFDEETGKEVQGAVYKTVSAHHTEVNADSAEQKRLAILAKRKTNSEVTDQAYKAQQAKAKAGEFTADSIDKELAKNATGAELAMMDSMSEMFKNMAKHFKDPKISELQAAGGTAAHMKVIAEEKEKDALRRYGVDWNSKEPSQAKIATLLTDIKRLLGNPLTRGSVSKEAHAFVDKHAPEYFDKQRGGKYDEDDAANAKKKDEVDVKPTPKPEVSPISDKNEKPFSK